VTRWQQQAREAVRQRKLGYFESLDGFPSLDQSLDLNTPDLKCVDGATIRSQGAQAYTQFVSLHDVDQARSLLPIGSSDNPASPSYRSTLSLWERAELHPAPLSRSAVLALMQSRTMLAGETSK
jgi:acyl-homoserine lactone acylase PvdQ